jgi:hypothetical protein
MTVQSKPCLNRPSFNSAHSVLRPKQHLRSIDILPPGLADIDRAHFAVCGHEPDAVSQSAIVPAAAGPGALKIIKDCLGTDKQTRIDRVVVG